MKVDLAGWSIIFFPSSFPFRRNFFTHVFDPIPPSTVCKNIRFATGLHCFVSEPASFLLVIVVDLGHLMLLCFCVSRGFCILDTYLSLLAIVSESESEALLCSLSSKVTGVHCRREATHCAV